MPVRHHVLSLFKILSSFWAAHASIIMHCIVSCGCVSIVWGVSTNGGMLPSMGRYIPGLTCRNPHAQSPQAGDSRVGLSTCRYQTAIQRNLGDNDAGGLAGILFRQTCSHAQNIAGSSVRRTMGEDIHFCGEFYECLPTGDAVRSENIVRWTTFFANFSGQYLHTIDFALSPLAAYRQACSPDPDA